MRLGIFLLVAALAAGACGARESDDPTLGIGDVLGGASAGFAIVEGPRAFDFPADHGPHPDYRSEWWYFTGNVESAQGERFGFQLTFFRFRISAERHERRSAWAPAQLYMAHFAVSDVAARRFHAFERYSRGALDLAGARAAPFRVWIEDWSASLRPGPGEFATRLRAREGATGIELDFGPGEGPLLHGDEGYSRKNAEPGNASYYYSYPRMPVSGRLSTPRGDFEVSGEGWFDREWSTSALGSDQVGWDWFALHLSDGSELMLYQLRRRDGSADPFSYGVLVEADGSVAKLSPAHFMIDVKKTWQSPDKKAIYPSEWRLQIPSGTLELDVEPLLEDQEWRHAFRYWEGAVSLRGRRGPRRVTGVGYAELTGYRIPDP